MTTIQIKNKLDADHAGASGDLYRLIGARVGKSPSKLLAEAQPFWSGEWWGLTTSALYNKLSIGQQQRVLHELDRMLLNESYFIEKSGLAYTAKMMLLADSTDVAQLYAFIAADEARHLAWLEPYVRVEDKTRPTGSFLGFLSELIESAPPHLLVFLVQIILEGWGLDHYRRMSNECSDFELKGIFADILKDEALHHRSGQVLFDSTLWSKSDFELVRKSLQWYTEMVRVGPLAAVAVCERVVGGLSLNEIEDLLVALNHVEESTRKLSLLKHLMQQPGVEPQLQQLDDDGYFRAADVATAARIYRDNSSAERKNA
jgi:rubrerythrin